MGTIVWHKNLAVTSTVLRINCNKSEGIFSVECVLLTMYSHACCSDGITVSPSLPP